MFIGKGTSYVFYIFFHLQVVAAAHLRVDSMPVPVQSRGLDNQVQDSGTRVSCSSGIRRIEHKEIYFWPQYKSRYACWYRNTMNMISLNLPVRTLHFKTFNLLSWKISNLFGNLPRPIWCAVTPVFNECDLTDESTQRRLLEHDDMVISLFKKATLHLHKWLLRISMD